MSASELREKIGGYLRRIRERFIVQRGQLRHDLQRVGRGHIELLVICAEKFRYGCRMDRLVVTPVLEPDGVCANFRAAAGLHQRSHCRRIDTSRQKCSQWHIRMHTRLDCRRKEVVKLIHCSTWINASDRPAGWKLPIALDGLAASPRRGYPRNPTRLELANPFVNAERRGHIAKSQECGRGS